MSKKIMIVLLCLAIMAIVYFSVTGPSSSLKESPTISLKEKTERTEKICSKLAVQEHCNKIIL